MRPKNHRNMIFWCLNNKTISIIIKKYLWFFLLCVSYLTLTFKLYPTTTEKELAYYVSGNVLEPVNCDYMFSELVNPIFIKSGEQVKVSVSVKYLDQRTKAIQISQFDLTLEKDSNWKIVK